MPFELSSRDLEVIRLVAATGSLTRTAELIHVSQPAISQRLALIQERLGTELFERRDGRMHATPAAERLALAAAAVDRVLESALDDVHEMLDARARNLRITTQCYTCYRWLSFVIRDMLLQFPSLTVDVVPEAIEDPYGAIERDEVDIAVVHHPEPASTIRHVALFGDELYAVMSAEHPLASRSFLNPDNFAGEDLILYTSARHAFVEEILEPAGVHPGKLRQVRMTEAIVELARAGQGIAVLAGWVLNDQVSKHGLVPVRIGRGGYRRQWQALVSERCPDDIAAGFIDSVRKTTKAITTDHWRKNLEAA
jgi:LysR family transcriptional regulator for metE and metH